MALNLPLFQNKSKGNYLSYRMVQLHTIEEHLQSRDKQDCASELAIGFLEQYADNSCHTFIL